MRKARGHIVNVVSVGELFKGRYQIESKLGEGGMATVYQATDLENGATVAIKLLLPHLSNDLSIRSRFLSEAHIQNQLAHPNIAQVHAVIDERGMLGFVMEWCNAGDLRGWMLREKHSPSVPQWQELVLPIIRAMAYAHREGFVHRDLKPSNILLHEQDGRLIPKVSDFGIAKVLGQGGQTRTGALMGTLAYMSPEQLEDSKQVSPLSDLYSLGVLMYQLATGRLPFTDKGPSIVLQIFREPPVPPSEAPKPLRNLLLRCLEKVPASRYPDCMALYEALQKALQAGGKRTWVPLSYPADMEVEQQLPKEQQEAISSDVTAIDRMIDAVVSETIPPGSFLREPTPVADSGVPLSPELAPTEEAPAFSIIEALVDEAAPTKEQTAYFAERAASVSVPTTAPPHSQVKASSAHASNKWGIVLVLVLLALGSLVFWLYDPFGLLATPARQPVSTERQARDAGQRHAPSHKQKMLPDHPSIMNLSPPFRPVRRGQTRE